MTVLREYEDFYNTHRPHRSLIQAAPHRSLIQAAPHRSLIQAAPHRSLIQAAPHRSLIQAAPLHPLPDSVTDLDHFRVRRCDRAGGVIRGHRLVA
jgi:hypothetical protein